VQFLLMISVCFSWPDKIDILFSKFSIVSKTNVQNVIGQNIQVLKIDKLTIAQLIISLNKLIFFRTTYKARL